MRFSGFLLFALFLLTSILVSALNNKKYEEAVMTVGKTNKSTLLTIESSYGDLTDRVNKRKQPAFDHRLLKDHKIRRLSTQRKQLKGHKLRNNSIPMRRSTNGVVMGANFVSEFGKRQHPFYHQLPEAPPVYQFAVAGLRQTIKIYGAEAIINVWEPSVFSFDQSKAQIWMQSGHEDNLEEVIEFGWHVYPSLYGDSKARFFISWTSDSYRGSGCYNLFCEGFMDTSIASIIGNSFDSVSKRNGPQKQMIVNIFKQREGVWWLKLDDRMVGFWPDNIFVHLREAAYQVNWGGEVSRVKIDDQYKPTAMGSGSLPTTGFGEACFMKDLKVAFSYEEFSLVKRQDLTRSVTDDRCYNISTLTLISGLGHIFYFGGSANDPVCLS